MEGIQKVIMERTCKYCRKPLEGRANKLYHYECKIKYNNQLRKARVAPVLQDHNNKISNHDVLQALELDYKSVYTPEELKNLGFNFGSPMKLWQTPDHRLGADIGNYRLVQEINETYIKLKVTRNGTA